MNFWEGDNLFACKDELLHKHTGLIISMCVEWDYIFFMGLYGFITMMGQSEYESGNYHLTI